MYRLLFAGFWLLFAVVAVAQSPEQLEMLEALSPEQRAQVLEQMVDEKGSGPNKSVPEFPQLVMDKSLTSLDEIDDEGLEEEQRITAGSTVVVELSYPEEINIRTRLEIEEELSPRVLDLVGSSVFEINRAGILLIDDFYSIPLAGLTAEEAAIRIRAEADFQQFDVLVSLLPLEPTGFAALSRFGYELFSGVPTTFAPATDIPVPTDYIIGPGDTVIIQLFGNQNKRYVLKVSREGNIDLPSIGPISVKGLSFSAMREELQTRIRGQMIGVESSIALGELRSIRIFVLGDAQRPGSYTVSGLSTITNALFLSGGVNEQGSLRSIQLKRNGRTVQTLDLYKLLLQGDTRADVRLQPGDAIFVPPLGKTSAVGGQVLRPAIYELRNEKTVDDLINLAGGLLPSAYPYSARLERIDRSARRSVIDVNLQNRQGARTTIRDGDVLWVEPVIDEVGSGVVLSGHVHRPGARQFITGMRLSDLIKDSDELRPMADLHYILVRREQGPERAIEVFSADLGEAWSNRGTAKDPVLEVRDQIMVFDIGPDRAERLLPLLEDLRMQSRSGELSQEVTVGGRIIGEGVYPLEAGMRVSDLIRAGGGLQEAAYTLQAELTRYYAEGGETRRTELLTVDLGAILSGDRAADLQLRAYDNLIIKEIPQWQVQESVVVDGEVRFPGTYILQRGETMSSVLARAGGLTDLAFPTGSVFVRKDLMRREQEQIKNLASRLEADIVAFSLQALQTDANAAQALSIGQSLLQQLRETRATGRMVIDVDNVLANQGDPVQDVVMRDGDKLLIPKKNQEVTVLGEVQYATSHIYQPGLGRDDYISRSGGLTDKADKKRIYVVRANGAVLAGEGSRWFQRANTAEIRPGDTIVAPLDADRMSSLALWTNVSQIVYQLALAAASASAIGVF
ncbi:MAG: hypothetical protein HKM98_08000 [Gammaproteobacteria bacterium]|nr:hypothetical protein [Gammaproteobacteria bacterium]